jgi:FOG: HEAT repeat
MFAKRSRTINVDGAAHLSAKLDSVLEQRRTAAPGRYWISYTFSLRPNVALELVLNNAGGSQIKLGAITGAGAKSTRRAGLFLSYEGIDLNRASCVLLVDLDQPHDWDGATVYWLGLIETDQSLDFIEHLFSRNSDAESCSRLLEAAAVHNDPQAETLLKKWARSSTFAEARMAAIKWLGRIGGNLEFLAEIVTNESENSRVREQAAMSIGKSTEPEAVAILRRLYETVSATSLKIQLISALSKQLDTPAAVEYLRSISNLDRDQVLVMHSRSKLDKADGKKWKKKTRNPRTNSAEEGF